MGWDYVIILMHLWSRDYRNLPTSPWTQKPWHHFPAHLCFFHSLTVLKKISKVKNIEILTHYKILKRVWSVLIDSSALLPDWLRRRMDDGHIKVVVGGDKPLKWLVLGWSGSFSPELHLNHTTTGGLYHLNVYLCLHCNLLLSLC